MMSFGQIADELGISRGAVFATYKAAMRKLARKPETVKELLHLADLMHQARLSRKEV
jgi:predicted DNA-binding protein YlxM (UPF0122 family)